MRQNKEKETNWRTFLRIPIYLPVKRSNYYTKTWPRMAFEGDLLDQIQLFTRHTVAESHGTPPLNAPLRHRLKPSLRTSQIFRQFSPRTSVRNETRHAEGITLISRVLAAGHALGLRT